VIAALSAPQLPPAGIRTVIRWSKDEQLADEIAPAGWQSGIQALKNGKTPAKLRN